MTNSRNNKSRTAFSLVEVALAIGIMSFALVSIIGLLSLAMQISRDSADSTNIALMTRSVTTMLRASGTNGVTGYTYIAGLLPANGSNSITYYFDENGVQTTSTNGYLVSDTVLNGVMVSNTSATTNQKIYLCTIKNKTPTSFPLPANYMWLQLDFSWPFKAPASARQHKYIYANLAQYD